jgi:MSHA biogenesis protein MshI
MAIRVGSDTIDLAHVQPGDLPQVMCCESYRSGSDSVSALRKLRKTHRLDRYHCTTWLDSAEYQVHQLDAPNVPEQERRPALRWGVKDLIDYPVDTAAIDVMDIPNGGAQGRTRSVFAFTASNASIERRIQPFTAAGLSLEALEVHETVQRNLALRYEREGRAIALLAFHNTGGILTITGQGELLVSRRIEIPIERLLIADADQRSQYLDRLALELQRSLDNFDRQFSFIGLERVLLAYVPAQTGLKDTLRANLDIPVDDLDLAAGFDLGRVPELSDQKRQSQCMMLLAAALRSDSGAGVAK